jgi:hypothetical protein
MAAITITTLGDLIIGGTIHIGRLIIMDIIDLIGLHIIMDITDIITETIGITDIIMVTDTEEEQPITQITEEIIM